MGIIVDTNILIGLERGTLQIPDSFSGDGLFLSAITVSELLVGIKMASTDRLQKHRKIFVDYILDKFPVCDFDFLAAEKYGDLYAEALLSGKRANIRVHDLQIAATALSLGYKILTNNISDFAYIDNLEVISLD